MAVWRLGDLLSQKVKASADVCPALGIRDPAFLLLLLNIASFAAQKSQFFIILFIVI